MSTEVLVCLQTSLHHLTFPAQVSWVIHDGGSSRWKKKKMNSDLKPVTSSAKPHAACKTVQLFLYMQNIHNHDKQCISTSNWCRFIRNIGDQTKQLSLTKFLGGWVGGWVGGQALRYVYNSSEKKKSRQVYIFI